MVDLPRPGALAGQPGSARSQWMRGSRPPRLADGDEPRDGSPDGPGLGGEAAAGEGGEPGPVVARAGGRCLRAQLDLRMDKTWRFKSWQLAFYVDIQNVYNFQHPEGVSYNFNYTKREFITGLPFLPSIGLRGSF